MRRSQFATARIVTAAIGFGWLAVIMASAGPRSPAPSWRDLPDVGAVLLLIGALVFGCGLFIMAQFRLRTPQEESSGGTWVVAVMTVVVVLGLTLFPPLTNDEAEFEQPREEPAPTLEEFPEAEPRSLPESVVMIGRSDFVIVLVVAVAAALIARRLTSQSDQRAEPDGREDGPEADDPRDQSPVDHHLVEALLGSIEEAMAPLESIRDPRQAVLVAYAVLEQSLMDQGYGRSPEVTTREHVQGALNELPVNAGPFTRLAERYDVARFSTEAMSPIDRRDSIVDLRSGLAELGALMSPERTR